MTEPLANAALRPVSARKTVADTVYLSLREALIIGRFDPGQVLTIGALAETACIILLTATAPCAACVP